MNGLIGAVIVYGLMFLASTGVGLFMMFAPARFGKLINESFGLFPQVKRDDWGKKLIVRMASMGILAFAIHIAIRIEILSGSN